MVSESANIVPVILSGGSGSRLWPLSRKALPKQLLALSGADTMIQQAVARVQGEGFAQPIVIANQEHRFLVAQQLQWTGGGRPRIVLEPVGRNTAPAAAVAALMVQQQDPDGLVFLMPSDHVVRDVPALRTAIKIAARAAQEGALVTFGITPLSAETGYGYIKAGQPGPGGALRVEKFIEKPNAATAQAYLLSGEYSWNSGIFLFAAKAFLAEMQKLQPAMLAFCRQALSDAQTDLDFIRLDEQAFQQCPSQSIDYAIMEKASNVAVVPVTMGWSDVGSWNSLWSIAEQDADGNAISGDVIARDVKGSYIRSEGPLVAALCVDDLVIVATKDAVLICGQGASQDVRVIVDMLESHKRTQHVAHPVVHRPWGSYESIDAGQNFQVKRITVKPGAKLSLQKHHHRAEHWVVVSGKALVTCGDKTMELGENESTYIPQGILHRLENALDVPLHLIEVQSGSYLGEDDIVRVEDSYGRVPSQRQPR